MDAVKELRRKAAFEESLAAGLRGMKRKADSILDAIERLESQRDIYNSAADLIENDPRHKAFPDLLALAREHEQYLRTPHTRIDPTVWLGRFDDIMATLSEG